MKLGNKNLNMVRLFTALFIISVAGLALAKPHINAVKVQKVSDGVNVVVSGQDLSTPNRYQIKANYSIIEFKAGLTGKGQFVRARTVTSKWVKYGWYRAHPPIVRVLICTKPGSKLVVTKDDATNNFVIKTVTKAAVDTQYIRPIITRMAAVAPVTGDETVTVNPVTETLTTPVTETAKTVTPTTTVNVTKTKPNYYVATTNTKPTTTEIAGLTGNTTFTNRRVLKPTTGIVRVSPVSLDFVNADIGNVLKALAIQTGANIVTSPDVKGTVTVSLSGVTVDNALDLITKLSNLKYAKIDNTYVVGTPDTISMMAPTMAAMADPLKNTMEVIRINYGDPYMIKEAVKKAISIMPDANQISIFSSGGILQSSNDGDFQKVGSQSSSTRVTNTNTTVTRNGDSDTASRSAQSAETDKVKVGKLFNPEKFIVMSGPPPLVAAAKQLVEQLDSQFAVAKQSGQAMVIYVAQHTNAKMLKAVLDGDYTKGLLDGANGAEDANLIPMFPSVQVTVGPVPISSERSVSESLISTGGSSSTGGSATAKTKWTEPPMTLILQGPEADVQKVVAFVKNVDVPAPQVMIEAKVVDINLANLKQWGLNWDFLNSTTVTDAPGQSKFSGTIPTGTDDTTSSTFTVSKFFNNLRVTANIDAMLRKNQAKILASPHVSVLDGKYAEVFIGDEINYVASITQSSTGPSIVTGTVKAGIQLNVGPRISLEDGTITMNIRPEVSVVTSFLDVPGGGRLPQVARRYADTSIRVKDGETIIIGGLIREDDLKVVKKVPLLGELPILGFLFTNYKQNKTRNEVVIIITPRIVKD
ncbi:MAG: secretin and TonB N-terminal domain-containing protein [bacterium]